MSFAVNNVVIGGNLAQEVDYRCTRSGTAVCTMSLAINGGSQENPKTTFVEVRAWERTAEVCRQYLSKGSPVLFEGSLELNQWEDRNGNKRSKLIVVARRMQLVGRSREDNNGGYDGYSHGGGMDRSVAPPPMPDVPDDMPPDEDIPF